MRRTAIILLDWVIVVIGVLLLVSAWVWPHQADGAAVPIDKRLLVTMGALVLIASGLVIARADKEALWPR